MSSVEAKAKPVDESRAASSRRRTNPALGMFGAMWLRDMLRLRKEPSRWFGVVLQPLMFWAIIGSGMAETFTLGGAEGITYLEFFYPVFNHYGGRQDTHVACRHILREALTRMAVWAGRQQHAVLVEEAPVHGVAGEDVLRDRVQHEVPRDDDLGLAGGQALRIDHAAHAAEVVGV